MSELKDVITSYNNLSFCDRIVFYTTISNDITVDDDMQSFLVETRFDGGESCIYCDGTHVVKNGKRKDGIQRYLCRDCHRYFIPSSDSITSRTRKPFFRMGSISEMHDGCQNAEKDIGRMPYFGVYSFHLAS